MSEMLLKLFTRRTLAQLDLDVRFGAKPRQWEGTDWIRPSHHRFKRTDRSRLQSSVQLALTLSKAVRSSEVEFRRDLDLPCRVARAVNRSRLAGQF